MKCERVSVVRSANFQLETKLLAHTFNRQAFQKVNQPIDALLTARSLLPTNMKKNPNSIHTHTRNVCVCTLENPIRFFFIRFKF